MISTSPGAWSEEVAALFQTAARDPLVGVETLRRSVENGARLIIGTIDGVMCFAYVATLNQCDYGSEAVIVATAGIAVEGVSMAKVISKDVAQRYPAADRIRCTASRAGMERVLERLGYEKQAVIYTKKQGAGHVL